MRSWNNQLFLGAMPGWYEDLTLWEDALQQNEIDCIVSLTSEEETTEKSPEFATWLSASPPEYEIVRLPVPDYGVPTGHQVEEFWDAALDVARDLKQGRRAFVHCGAGIGRTGLFAVAVLMGLGHTYEDARASIEAVGSGPETAHQQNLVAAGPPAPMVQKRNTYGRDWRPDQKALTRETIDEMDIVAFSFQMGGPNKGCMIKHLDRRSGYITLADASSGTLRVFDYGTDQLLGTYSDVDALIDDGWTVST